MSEVSATVVHVTRDRTIVVYYLAAALVWGASFLFIKVGLDEGLSPAQVVLARLTLGALALLVAMVVLRRRWPRGARTWGHLAVLGVILCVVPFLLFSWAGQHVTSGLASILNATTPLMTAAWAAALLPTERLVARQRVGLLVGIVGVVVVVAPWTWLAGGVSASIPAVLACLGATASYGIGTTYLRRFVTPLGLPPESVAAGQIGAGALLVLAASPFIVPVSTLGTLEVSWPLVGAMVALGALGTGAAYVWFNRIVDAWGAQRASTVTYLTPLVGVVLGALVLGERVHWYEPVGGVLVVLGVVVAQRGKRPPVVGAAPGEAVGARTA